MRLARLLPVLVLVSFTSPALAQDDLLAPLTPSTKKAKPAKKKKPARASRVVKKKKAAAEEEFLAPLVEKTELEVKVAGGLRAKVFIDGREVGAVPGEAFEVEPGEHTVTVKRPGFADAIREVTVAEGERTELSVNLEAVSGVLTVLASVPAAKVFLDGSFEGSVPLRDLLVVPGSHEVKVSADGYVSEVTRLSVKAGKDYTVNAELKKGEDRGAVAAADRPARTDLTLDDDEGDEEIGPVSLVAESTPEVSAPPAWYQRWYVWAGAGAVVAGAVATGMVVANSGPDLSRNGGAAVCNGPCAGVLIPSLR